MLLNDKNLQIQDFPVNKDYGNDETFFRLITDYGEVQLPKLEFQKNEPLPDKLSCKIKGIIGGKMILSHNMPRYVSDFYADGFSKGQEFEFRVISVPEGPKGFYRLSDDKGLIFKLHDTKVPLTKGQSVKCKFDALGPDFFSLRRAVGDAEFPMLSLSDITRMAGIHGMNPSRMAGMLQKVPELEGAIGELNHGRPIWVMNAIRTIRKIMPQIFDRAVTQFAGETVNDMLRGYERVLLNLLQGSGFLRNVKGSERAQIQAELTAQIDQLDIYKRTNRIIASKEQNKFIDTLLQNLKESGYLYHPTTQFSIMMILFRIMPELVNSSLGTIFDTLMGWDLETWKTEPFRQAFVEQLEIYISETRKEIDLFLQAETPADNEKIEKMLTAIAIQHSLATKNDTIDIRLNTSLFYRYLAMLRSAKADVLLHKSFLALMGVKLPTDYTWADIKEPTMMMTRAAVDPPATAVLPPDLRYFTKDGDNLEVEVGPEGIAIGFVNDDTNNALPNGMLPWPGLRINVDRTINRQKLKTMEGHAEFWNSIEKDLFMPDEVTTEQTASRRAPDIDDTVRIIVERVIPSAHDSNRIEAFECKIVDDHFIEGRGILPAENIVNYNLHGVTAGTFRHDNGEHMKFDAQVVDIDDNDTLIFSLADAAYMAIRDMANAGEKCYAVITKDNGRSYSAISEKGFGLYVNKENDGTPPFHRGTVIYVSITGFNNEAIQSVVEEGPIDTYTFYNPRALHNLLKAIAVDADEYADEEIQYDEEDLMPREDLRELIDILRYKAIACRKNPLMAFDYLSYARILALIIDDQILASTIKAHKDVLLLHQHYAKNKSIFAEDIDKIVEEAPDNTLIRRLANRLYIVAMLGHSEDNQTLWEITSTTTNDMEKELAQMVLSYNMLYDINHDDPTAATIKDKIAKKLNVESEQRNLKYYGSESQYVEFKSSLVYPAKKGRAGISMADPDRQEFEILHIIAGFLNTTGGTLYIGVNDDHYECGLEDDFSFYRLDTSERNNKYRRSIKSLDNLANYLQNRIDSAFSLGKNVGDYAKASIDEESVKGVIMVKIDPCPHIVYLDNAIYVRHSSKTEPLIRKDEIDLFVSDRQRLYKQLVEATKGEDRRAEIQRAEIQSSEIQSPEIQSPEIQSPEIQSPEDRSLGEEMTTPNNFSILTSKLRKNILHEYEDPDHFITPCIYIRFVNDNEYIVTTDEWSIDPDNDRFALTVTEDELDDYLLLVYEGEYAIKVRMRELLEKEQNKPFAHFGDRKLIFAAPMAAAGGLYTMHSNAKNTIYERVTPADRITPGSMGTAPEHLLEAESIKTEMYEVVRPQKMPEMTPILSTSMKRAQIGSLVKGISSVKTSVADAEKSALKRLR